MEILGAVLGSVVKCIISPVERQLGYLIYYKRNMKDLEKQLKNLQLARERVQNLVKEAKGNSYAIYDGVSSWLVEVDAELPQQINEGGSNRINDSNPQQNESKDSNLSCLNLGVICYPRKTKKRVDNILRLIDDGKKFDKDNVGYSVPLPNTKCTTLPLDYQILESRTLMAEKIKNALADPNVNKVGVSGMGGVGKTKLLDEVKKLVLESNLFNRVIIVTVGQSKDVKRIQDEIGGILNMKLEANSEEVRASLLQIKIVEMKDNILIVLDDLWKEYDLEKDFGIPCRLESRKDGCKILMTSRFRDLLTNKLNIEKLFEVNPLSEKESWKFFVDIVGKFVEVGIEDIAKNVVKECGGLPLALTILAQALKGKIIQIWNDVLNKLNNHACVDIPGVGKDLYNCVKLSYDSIEDEEAKSLFLMCSVFPDDYRISVDDLQMYVMGMGMLNYINNWEDAMNRVMKLVDDLTSSCLLIYFKKDYHVVQMHDVIRDVAKHIASKINMPSLTYGCGQTEWREEERRGSYYTIFVDYADFFDLLPKLEFPNLRLLILRGPWCIKDTQIPDAFFEGMENLRVLDMKNVCFESSRTSLTHSLKNLQTLCLSSCEHLDTIGELQKLKILNINGSQIEELPANMSQLTELKVLKVFYCFRLKVIHPNIISSMTKLEELSLVNGFKGWGEEVSYKGKKIKNVKVSELNGLTQLSILRIDIQNADMLSNELSLERVGKLQDFNISCGGDRTWGTIGPRTLRLNINWKTISWESGVLETLMQGCEYLHVFSNSVDFTKALFKPNANYFYPRLKYLDITIDEEDSTHMAPHQVQNITPFFATSDHQVSFLEKLSFWHRSSESFPKLQFLELIGFEDDGMVTLSLEMSKLVYTIENFTINNAIELVQVFQNGEENERDAKLKTLNLERLPKLTRVWEDNNTQMTTSFDSLKRMTVRDCVNLKHLLPSSITFLNLTDLQVEKCKGMMNLFSSSVANKLVNLTTMSITECEGMSSIVVGEGEEEEITFKRLNVLKLKDLPRLRSFHSGKSMLKFPCLDNLYIKSCHEMKTFTYGIISYYSCTRKNAMFQYHKQMIQM